MLSTLRLRWPLGQTLLLAISLLLPMAGIAEAIFRADIVQGQVAGPDLTSPAGQFATPHFELKWNRLARMVEQEGEIDCVFLGGNMLSNDLQPGVFERAFQRQTGQSIRSFNFGDLEGPNAVLLAAEFILEHYDPELIIISTNSFSYEDQARTQHQAGLEDQLAEPITNWLRENSMAYRYYASLQQMQPQPRQLPIWAEFVEQLDQTMWPDGFIPYEFPPPQGPLGPPEERLIQTYQQFTPPHVRPDSLAGVMALQKRVPILLVELPVHSTLMYYFKGGAATYQALMLDPVDNVAARHGVPFWHTSALEIVPEEGWGNRSRLNPAGAEIFSRWLGTEVGRAVQEGRLEISSGPDRTGQP